MVQLPSTVSSTALSTFTQCPRKYRYQYVEGLLTAQTLPQLTGEIFHTGLEHLFALPALDRTPRATEAAVASAFTNAVATGTFAHLDLDHDQLASVEVDLRGLVAGYLTLEDPTAVVVESIEEWFELGFEGARFVGRLDRVDRQGDDVVIVDYKTGKAPNPRFEESQFDGLRRYAMLYEATTGVAPVELRLYFPRARLTLSRKIPAKAIVGFTQKATSQWEAVRRAAADDAFPARRGPLCGYCDFQPFCPGEPPASHARRPHRPE